MDGPEWAAGKLSEDHKDNRWSLLSADIREIEQRLDLQPALDAFTGEPVEDVDAPSVPLKHTEGEELADSHPGPSPSTPCSHAEGSITLIKTSSEQIFACRDCGERVG